MRNVTDILRETTYSYHCAGGFLHLYRAGDSICGGIFEDFPLLLKDMTKLKVLGKIWFSCCKIPKWLWEFCLSWVKDGARQLYGGCHTLWQRCRINCCCSWVKKFLTLHFMLFHAVWFENRKFLQKIRVEQKWVGANLFLSTWIKPEGLKLCGHVQQPFLS